MDLNIGVYSDSIEAVSRMEKSWRLDSRRWVNRASGNAGRFKNITLIYSHSQSLMVKQINCLKMDLNPIGLYLVG